MSKRMQYSNSIKFDPDAVFLFLDMNSYFASCAQQFNPALRGKPVAVCGASATAVILAPSIEAKTFGIKTGMRLNEARLLCPSLLAVEIQSDLYRQYHKGIIDILRSYSEEVIPKSIDEAVINLSRYKLVYPDPMKLALQIKQDIRDKVGDWLSCSIGIAPNTFLAKVASNMQKPDGLVRIDKHNIDEMLAGLELTDLPGIADRTASRLKRAGLFTPLQLRNTSPQVLKKMLGSVLGYYWHYRLNFAEVDFYSGTYKNMSAVRTLSAQQRNDINMLDEIFLSLCMRLEARLVKHRFFTSHVTFFCSYQNRSHWDLHVHPSQPLQDGTDIYHVLMARIRETETQQDIRVFTPDLRSIGVSLHNFVPDTVVQYELFDNKLRRDALRRTVYDIKDNFGAGKLIKAVELRDEEVVKDIIGFGSVKDMYKE